jgi:hypothetical protein
MDYNQKKNELEINKKLSELDKLVLDFIKIIEFYTDYVIISGYVSILLGRARATEDIDIFVKKMNKEKFSKMYFNLKKSGFWCLNAESLDELYNYLEEGLAIRFARINQVIPNFEIKYPNKQLELDSFNDCLTVVLSEGRLKISSLERQIAFKRYYLKSQKDVEDALHIEEVFKNKIDYTKVNMFREQIEREL